MASQPVKRPLAEPPSDDALSEDTSKATKMPRSMLAQRSLNVTAVPLNWPYEAFVHFYPLSFAYGGPFGSVPACPDPTLRVVTETIFPDQPMLPPNMFSLHREISRPSPFEDAKPGSSASFLSPQQLLDSLPCQRPAPRSLNDETPTRPHLPVDWKRILGAQPLDQYCEQDQESPIPAAVADASPHFGCPSLQPSEPSVFHLAPSLSQDAMPATPASSDPTFEVRRCSTPEYAWYAPVNSEAPAESKEWPALDTAEREAYEEFLVEPSEESSRACQLPLSVDPILLTLAEYGETTPVEWSQSAVFIEDEVDQVPAIRLAMSSVRRCLDTLRQREFPVHVSSVRQANQVRTQARYKALLDLRKTPIGDSFLDVSSDSMITPTLSRSILTFFAATLRDFEGGPATVESVSRAWEAVLVRHGAFNQSLVRDALTLQAKDDMESYLSTTLVPLFALRDRWMDESDLAISFPLNPLSLGLSIWRLPSLFATPRERLNMSLLVCLTTLTASHPTAGLPGRRRFLYEQMTWSDVTFYCKTAQGVELYSAAINLWHGSDQGPNQIITVSELTESVHGERYLDIVFLLMSAAMMDGIFEQKPTFADIPKGFDKRFAGGLMGPSPRTQLVMRQQKLKHPVFPTTDEPLRPPVVGRTPSPRTDSRVNYLLSAIAEDAQTMGSCTQEDIFDCARDLSRAVGHTDRLTPSDILERCTEQALSRCGRSADKAHDVSLAIDPEQKPRFAAPRSLLLAEHRHHARQQVARAALAALRLNLTLGKSQSRVKLASYRQSHIQMQRTRQAIQAEAAARSRIDHPFPSALDPDEQWIWIDAAKDDSLGFANVRGLAAAHARHALRKCKASRPHCFSSAAASTLLHLDESLSSRSTLYGEISSVSRTLPQGPDSLALLDFLTEQTTCNICYLSLADVSKVGQRSHLLACTKKLLSSVYLTVLSFMMEERSGGFKCSHSDCTMNQSPFASYEEYCRHVASGHLEALPKDGLVQPCGFMLHDGVACNFSLRFSTASLHYESRHASPPCPAHLSSAQWRSSLVEYRSDTLWLIGKEESSKAAVASLKKPSPMAYMKQDLLGQIGRCIFCWNHPEKDVASRTREFDGRDLKLHVFRHLVKLDKQGNRTGLTQASPAPAYRCLHPESPCKDLPPFVSAQDLGYHILRCHHLAAAKPSVTFDASLPAGDNAPVLSQPEWHTADLQSQSHTS